MFTQHNFTRGAALNRRLIPLTDAQILSSAPSVFAGGAHESRSHRYTYIPTIKIVEQMRAVGFVPVEAKQSRCKTEDRQDFTKHCIKFIQAGADSPTVGEVFPQVVVTNAHDGSSSYQLDAGMYRFACSNGLLVCDSKFGGLRLPHRGNIVDDVIEGSFEVINNANLAVERIEDWGKVTLAQPEQEAFARAALDLRFDGEPPIEAKQVLAVRRRADEGNDLWRTFNRVQEAIIKGGNRYFNESGRRMSTREVTGIDADTKLNRALWRLADEMKALKAA